MTDPISLSDPSRLAGSFTDFLRDERPDLMPQTLTTKIEPMEATTIVALRYADGVVMAGDRRATEGFSIAHRAMEKVFPADAFSAIGIAGAAGPAVEMVRLFQTELEYYEKVEGEALSLAGKANHLGRLIRANLPAAMQGFVVLPLFGGYDTRTGEGRIYRYDVTGGLSEETDYHSVGSGGRDAKNSMKKLYSRADDDRSRPRDRDRRRSADRRRRRGCRHGRARSGPRDLPDGLHDRRHRRERGGRRRRSSAVARAILETTDGSDTMSMPGGFMYASPEQVMKDRADYARRNIARGKPIVALEYTDGVLLLAENPSTTLHKVSEIYDRIAFAGVGKYNEYENLRIMGIRQADLKGYAYSREDVTRALAREPVLAGPRTGLHRLLKPYEVEVLVAGVGEGDDGCELYHVTFDGVMTDEQRFAAVGGQADALKTVPRRTIRRHDARSGGSDRDRARSAAIGERRPSQRPGRRRRARPQPDAPQVPPPARRGDRERVSCIGTRLGELLSQPVTARRLAAHMERRIFGLESEYGVTCTFRGQRRLSPDEVARYLFRKVVQWGRSSNVFLDNGARLYLDVGSHPEYATPECDNIPDLIAHDKAGERRLEIAADGCPGTPQGRGHRRRRLPLQEQHRLGRETPTAVTRTTSSPATASSSASPTS